MLNFFGLFLMIFIMIMAKYRSAQQYLLLGIGLNLVGIALVQMDVEPVSFPIITIGVVCLFIGFIKKESNS